MNLQSTLKPSILGASVILVSLSFSTSSAEPTDQCYTVVQDKCLTAAIYQEREQLHPTKENDEKKDDDDDDC